MNFQTINSHEPIVTQLSPSLNQTALDQNNAADEPQLYLLQPPQLWPVYALSPAQADQVQQALQTLQQAFLVELPGRALSIVQDVLQRLAPPEMTPMAAEFGTGTSLKSAHARVVDGLMHIQHVLSPAPANVVAVSLLHAAAACLKLLNAFPEFDRVEKERLTNGLRQYGTLLARICQLPAGDIDQREAGAAPLPVSANGAAQMELEAPPAHIDYLWVWRQGHWVFLALVQGLILGLRRLVAATAANDLVAARYELETATQLMWASGAAMKLTGSFSKQVYQRDIRATMVVGDPKSLVDIEVSGIMFWDHHYLVNVIWKKEIVGLLRNLPPELHAAHAGFVDAYRAGLSAGHIQVCTKFGGQETTSLLSSTAMAVDFLKNIEQSRLRQIDPLHHMMNLAAESLVLGE